MQIQAPDSWSHQVSSVGAGSLRLFATSDLRFLSLSACLDHFNHRDQQREPERCCTSPRAAGGLTDAAANEELST